LDTSTPESNDDDDGDDKPSGQARQHSKVDGSIKRDMLAYYTGSMWK